MRIYYLLVFISRCVPYRTKRTYESSVVTVFVFTINIFQSIFFFVFAKIDIESP